LPTIPEYKRQTEKDLWRQFETNWPGIFGALLDAVSCALSNEGGVHLASLPRMADFAQWAVAAEPALGLSEGDFMRAYIGNRESANDIALESSSASALIIVLVTECERWEGTASELLEELNSRASDELKKQYGWPKSPPALGGILKRLAPNLREVGIKTERGSGRQRRIWILEKSSNFLSRSSPLSRDLALAESHGDNDGSQKSGLTLDLSPKQGNANAVCAEGDRRDERLPRPAEDTSLNDETAERAAISEYDGGLERDEAEQIATLRL
jgi:hypothetical protein